MTTQEKLIKRKQSLLELAEYLQNISHTCKIHGVSRQHFYDIKKTYEEQGLEGLREKSRRKPCLKNRVAPEIEEAVVTVAYEYPAYGQTRASNELRKRGILVSPGGVRSIWVRHGLETFKKRLNLLEEKSAKEGIVYTEAQLVALEAAKRDRESHPDEIETEHPGYLLSQDTFYVGYLKGVGRIYQQTAVDTYSSVSFAKVYTAKVPVTAADLLNDRVLPFFEEEQISVLRVLTDLGTEFCGAPEKHPYELYLELNDIEHTKTKAKSPQTNGIWDVEEVVQTTLDQFFEVLRIRVHSILFLIIDDTLVQKTGKKIPGCAWHKDHAQKMANVFGHQWVLSALLYQDFLLPLWARLYHPKGTRGCGPFQTKIALAKKILKGFRLPVPCKLYVLADSWYWAKALVRLCRACGYHMISQLKSNSVLWIHGEKTKVTTLLTLASSYREVSLVVYGRTKRLHLAKFIGKIKDLGKIAVVVVKEKRKKPIYLVCTNLHLPAIDVVKYYAKRWKIEQMIKDLKQRLGFGHYQVRDLYAIERHVALVLLSYAVLIFLKILQWLRDQAHAVDFSIRLLAFHVRKHILLESITLPLNTMKVQFKQNILDTYLEQLCA